MKLLFPFLLCIGLVLLAGNGFAGSWRVELDGTGDFTVIQDAVDAAAEGDTIFLGVGRFETVRPIPWWEGFNATISIQKNGLVIIGSGSDQTIIGADSTFWFYLGIAAINDPALVHEFSIRSVAIVGGYSGIHYEAHGLNVEDCEFANSEHGIAVAECDNCIVRNSYFHDLGIGLASFLSNGSYRIIDCQVERTEMGIIMNSVSEAVVDNCDISECDSGIQYYGSVGTISNCRVTGVPGAEYGTGIDITRDSRVTMTGCSIDLSTANTNSALLIRNSAVLSGHNNVIRGGGMSSVWVNGFGLDDFHSNDIYKAGSFCLVSRLFSEFPNVPLGQLSLPNNYWGTEDEALVGEWIEDHSDNPDDLNYWMEVLYQPILDESVPVEKKSLGDLKALFRGGLE